MYFEPLFAINIAKKGKIMAHAHGHGGHGHGHDEYDENKVNQLRDDIKDLEKEIRAAKRAKRDHDDLDNQLAELQSQLRRLEAKDPLKQLKRRRDALKLGSEIHHLEEEEKKHHPHKKPLLLRISFGGWVAILFVTYLLFANFFGGIFPGMVNEFAGLLALVIPLYIAVKIYQLRKGSSGGNKDSQHSSAHH